AFGHGTDRGFARASLLLVDTHVVAPCPAPRFPDQRCHTSPGNSSRCAGASGQARRSSVLSCSTDLAASAESSRDIGYICEQICNDLPIFSIRFAFMRRVSGLPKVLRDALLTSLS